MKRMIGQMIDITSPEIVQIQIRGDSKVVWVNVNGECVLRCCQVRAIDLVYERENRSVKKVKIEKGTSKSQKETRAQATETSQGGSTTRI